MLTSETSLLPSSKFDAPELLRFKNGSFSYEPFKVNVFEVAGKPKTEKFPSPPALFMTAPGETWATNVKSFPGFGKLWTCAWEIEVEMSALSVWSSDTASLDTSTVTLFEPTNRWKSPEAIWPIATVTVVDDVSKPLAVTVIL